MGKIRIKQNPPMISVYGPEFVPSMAHLRGQWLEAGPDKFGRSRVRIVSPNGSHWCVGEDQFEIPWQEFYTKYEEARKRAISLFGTTWAHLE